MPSAMTLPAPLDELPADTLVTCRPDLWLALRRDVAGDLEAAGFRDDRDAPGAPSTLAGRRPLREFVAGGRTYLVRRFTHGGLLRVLTGERFLDPARPFRELLLQERLDALAIPTPRVVAARARRRGPGPFWTLEVVTPRLEDTIDLGHVLGMARRGEVSPAVRGRLVEAVGVLVRRLHDGGFVHADLQPNNLLVGRGALTGGPIELQVLDLDRSRAVPRLGDEERRSNLARLLRHVERRRREEGAALSGSDLARFWRGYDPGGERRREDLAALARARSRLAAGLHALGWLLERRLGRGTDARALPRRAPRP